MRQRVVPRTANEWRFKIKACCLCERESSRASFNYIACISCCTREQKEIWNFLSDALWQVWQLRVKNGECRSSLKLIIVEAFSCNYRTPLAKLLTSHIYHYPLSPSMDFLLRFVRLTWTVFLYIFSKIKLTCFTNTCQFFSSSSSHTWLYDHHKGMRGWQKVLIVYVRKYNNFDEGEKILRGREDF